MKYRKIGKDKDLISAIGFGTGFHLPENENGSTMEETIRTSIDNGVNFIDTAPVYGDGISEVLLGNVLQKIGRKKVFLASKVSPKDTTFSGVIKSAEDSLKRLKTDCIDLFQIHWPNPNVPLSETISAMEKLVEDGKIRYIGVSNFLLNEAKDTIKNLKNNNLCSLQVEYNLFERSIEKDTLPFCDSNNIILIAYSPLAQGNLVNGPHQRALLNDISKKYDCTPGQLVLNWLTHDESVVVIPNTSKKHRALENANSMKIDLSTEDYNFMSNQFTTPTTYVDPKTIRVSNDYNRKVYQSVQEAIENKMKMTPSPVELAEEMKKGFFLKPIRLKERKHPFNNKEYDLVEGRLRYWAWVIAFGWDKNIPSLIWKKEE